MEGACPPCAHPILAAYNLICPMSEPLSQAEFNRQVEALFETLGASAFATVAGRYPQYTPFVESDRGALPSQLKARVTATALFANSIMR